MPLMTKNNNFVRPADNWSWVEVLIITSLAIILSRLSSPEDPFYLTKGFPWPVVAPILVGLRYGFFHSLGSSIALLLAMEVTHRIDGSEFTQFSTGYAIFVLVIGMIVGEFRDRWERELVRTKVTRDYHKKRLDEFTRSYHVLKVSHDRIEQQLSSSSLNLRGALVALRKKISKIDAEEVTLESVGGVILDQLREYGSFEKASLYLYDKGELQTSPVASLGEAEILTVEDPLLRDCISEGKVTAIDPKFLSIHSSEETNCMMCIPLVDHNRTIHGVVVVYALPFFSLTKTITGFLSVMGGYIADIFAAKAEHGQVDDPVFSSLLSNIKRSIYLESAYQLPSVIYSIKVPSDGNSHAYSPTLANITNQLKRGLDIVYTTKNELETNIVILMPMTDLAGLDCYRSRLQKECMSQFGFDVNQLGIESASLELSTVDMFRGFAKKNLVNEHLYTIS